MKFYISYDCKLVKKHKKIFKHFKGMQGKKLKT